MKVEFKKINEISEKIIGSNIYDGYIIDINDSIDYKDILNYLCDKYGEGYLIYDWKELSGIHNDIWEMYISFRLFKKFQQIRIVVSDIKIVKDLSKKFNFSINKENKELLRNEIM